VVRLPAADRCPRKRTVVNVCGSPAKETSSIPVVVDNVGFGTLVDEAIRVLFTTRAGTRYYCGVNYHKLTVPALTPQKVETRIVQFETR